jgi:hypothetical protein
MSVFDVLVIIGSSSFSPMTRTVSHRPVRARRNCGRRFLVAGQLALAALATDLFGIPGSLHLPLTRRGAVHLLDT